VLQVRQPDDSSLAFLLGLALGVMATLSVVELWLNNALAHGVLPVTLATLLGAAAYYFAQPFFPEFEVCGGDRRVGRTFALVNARLAC